MTWVWVRAQRSLPGERDDDCLPRGSAVLVSQTSARQQLFWPAGDFGRTPWNDQTQVRTHEQRAWAGGVGLPGLAAAWLGQVTWTHHWDLTYSGTEDIDRTLITWYDVLCFTDFSSLDSIVARKGYDLWKQSIGMWLSKPPCGTSRSAQLPGQIRCKLAAARSSRSSRVRLAETLRGPCGDVLGIGCIFVYDIQICLISWLLWFYVQEAAWRITK